MGLVDSAINLRRLLYISTFSALEYQICTVYVNSVR